MAKRHLQYNSASQSAFKIQIFPVCYQVFGAPMILEFDAEIIYWRGPAPFFYARMPEEESHAVKAISNFVTYGWGVIPVRVRIGKTTWKTSLFPKDGRYLVPIKTDIRKAEAIEENDLVAVWLEIQE